MQLNNVGGLFSPASRRNFLHSFHQSIRLGLVFIKRPMSLFRQKCNFGRTICTLRMCLFFSAVAWKHIWSSSNWEGRLWRCAHRHRKRSRDINSRQHHSLHWELAIISKLNNHNRRLHPADHGLSPSVDKHHSVLEHQHQESSYLLRQSEERTWLFFHQHIGDYPTRSTTWRFSGESMDGCFAVFRRTSQNSKKFEDLLFLFKAVYTHPQNPFAFHFVISSTAHVLLIVWVT